MALVQGKKYQIIAECLRAHAPPPLHTQFPFGLKAGPGQAAILIHIEYDPLAKPSPGKTTAFIVLIMLY
jgi:hypothetical protein